MAVDDDVEIVAAHLAALQRLGEIGDQVVGVFQTHRNAQHAGVDALGLALLFRKVGVGLHGGVGDQGFGAAQAFGEHGHLHACEHVARRFGRVGAEGDHAAEAGALAQAEVVAGVVGQAGIVHVSHVRGRAQPAGQGERVALVALHAQGQGLQAARDQPGVEARKGGAGGHRKIAQLFRKVGPRAHQKAGEHVVVAVEVLGAAVHDHVGAKLQGVLEVGREEGVVLREQGARLVGLCGEGGDVGHGHRGIGRGFHEQAGRPACECGTRGVEVGRIDGVDRVAVLARHGIEQADRAAVKIPGGHDAVAGSEQLE